MGSSGYRTQYSGDNADDVSALSMPREKVMNGVRAASPEMYCVCAACTTL